MDQTHQTFWENELHTLPSVSFPDWKDGHPLQKRDDHSQDLLKIKIDELQRLAHACGVSLNSVLLATHLFVLHTITGQTDVATGLLFNKLEEDALPIGVTASPISVSIHGGSWRDLIKSVFDAEKRIAPYQDISFETIQKLFQQVSGGDGGYVFETIFRKFDRQTIEQSLEDDLGELSNNNSLQEAADFILDVSFGIDSHKNSLNLRLLYDCHCFDLTHIKQIAGYYKQTLTALMADVEAEYTTFCPLSDTELHLLVGIWNDTKAFFPQDFCVHDLITQQTKKTPDKVAVQDITTELSYSELELRANQLAHHLRAKGITVGDRVGICVSRSAEMVVALLGILKAGAAYVPMDPDLPIDRLDFILEDAQPTVIVSEKDVVSMLWQEKSHLLPILILLDADDKKTTSYTGDTFVSEVTPDDIAYIIYTSGSTGIPKGVKVHHRAMVNMLTAHQKTPGMKSDDVLIALATIAFDIHTFELFLPLITGARVVVATREVATDSWQLLDLIHTTGCTYLQTPPATYRMLLEAGLDARTPLKVLCGGEPLSRDLATALLKRGCELWNMYGPTETTVAATYFQVKVPTVPIPIGYPFANTMLFVLNPHQQLTPIGVPGELYIGGVGVSKGYLNRDELNAERFINLEICGATYKLYRTGDIVRREPDGALVFLNRIDNQVKIRGYRIELGEIEATLTKHEALKEALVVVQKGKNDNKLLVAYVILQTAVPQQPPQEAVKEITPQLRQFLQERLPNYMIPSYFVGLDRFPVTHNGKIDHAALPEPNKTRPILSLSYAEPRTQTEKSMVNVWENVLDVAPVGIHDNFFELGGTSVLSIRLINLINQSFKTELRVVKLYEYSTLQELAEYLDTGHVDLSALKRIQKKTAVYQKTSSKTEGIAIIGMAMRFPGANNADELWDVLSQERTTSTFFTDDEIDSSEPDTLRNHPDYVRVNGVVTDADKFDAKFFGVNPRVAQITDPQHRVFLELAWTALEDAGYDPNQYDGDIGLFAGMGENTYRRKLVEKRPDLMMAVGETQVVLGNEKDYVATHTSYKLNLTGPSIGMATACSTSLVAISQAYNALVNFECDMALSGGVSIIAPQNIGYLYQEGGMLSGDGMCRPFDADAQGTMFNNGAGIVLLKRLEDALADGDNIVAVIKGVGINNDGGDKASFTAPSVLGQAKAITQAQSRAGVSADTISYIEAHGTATPLGDPIEVEALTQAFRTQTTKRNFCGIGSLKSNMGHLVAAAGVAGLIKTALALQNKQIPASLHFNEPNPELNIEQTPFFVVDKLMDWPQSDTPRRAGVSSFGVGGTNAHVILEEAPQQPTSGSERPFPPILLSAKTEAALDIMTTNLAAHISKRANHNKQTLGDIAYTLQVGRKAFNHRRFVIGQSLSEVVEALKSGKAPTTHIDLQQRDIVFVFPGQGSQYVNMGLNLYEQEPLFQEIVDQCSRILESYLGCDLRTILYPAEGDEVSATAILKDTFYTQPALFTIEYALARLWLSWGIQPAAMMGHSVGEYVAACLAGIFSLEDALKIIATRGRLVSELPSGSMLSVRKPATEIEPLLPDTISLAASNSPKLCVVSGAEDDIAKFEAALKADGIACKHLHTSHAFHSEMMEPIIAPFAALMADIPLAAPQIPIISTVTGTWMQAHEATDPHYWANHVRAPVRFAEAVGEAWHKPERVLLEIGPRATCTTLARQQIKDRAVQKAIPSLTDTHENEAEWQALMEAVGRLWLCGASLDWSAFYAHESCRRVPLPTYPFARTRYWADPPAQQPDLALETAVSTTIQSNTNLMTTTNTIVPTTVISPSKEPTMSRKDHLLPKLSNLLADISGLDIDTGVADITFLELGFDSLFLTQASLALKGEFGIDLSFRQMLDEYPTLDTLAAYIDSQLPADAFAEEVSSATPVMTPATMPPSPVALPGQLGMNANPSEIERVVATQLQIMAQQLALLQGGDTVTTSLPAPAQAIPPQSAQIAGQETAVQSQPTADSEKTKTAVSTPPKPKKMQPFGAIARINTDKDTQFSEKQRDYLATFIERYNAYTEKSKQFTATHRAHHADPRVVTGFKLAIKELIYPIVVERSEEVYLHDLDGNRYIDILNGFGSNFLGYGNPIIKDAIHQQIEQGYELGPQQVLTGKTAKLVCDLTGMDRAGFCNTGSEAVMGCMRVARTVTGRRLIAIFSGSYHGIFDEVLVRGTKKLKSLPAAPGVMPSTVENVLVLEYGTEESLRILEERGPELAAIMVEPIQSRRPDFHPREFLQECRRICDDNGSAFIFDEVITGFRLNPGGAQAYYGIQADIASYGKIPGGNMPIGIIAGKHKWMDALDGGSWQYGDASVPEVGVTYFAGTFVRHPLAMAGAYAALSYLKEQGPSLQARVNAQTARLVAELNSYFEAVEVPIEIRSFGSLFKVFWTEDIAYGELLTYLLRLNGIHLYDGFPCFLTAAFTDAHVDAVIDAFKRSVAELQAHNFLPAPQAITTAMANQPPSPSARLGRDEKGQVIWSETGFSKTAVLLVRPITEAQQEIWLSAQMNDEANCSFNESTSLRFVGDLDAGALETAVINLTQRHEALRLTFTPDGETIVITNTVSLNIPQIDLSEKTPVERDIALHNLVEAEVTMPFDLTFGPLLRAKIVKLAADEHELLITFHHIIADGWSIAMLLSDLGKLYKAALQQFPANLPTAFKYSWYARYLETKQVTDEKSNAEVYWVDQFQGEIPLMDLPTDRPRPKLRTYTGNREDVLIDAQIIKELKKLGARAGFTFFTTLFAAFNLYLSKLLDQNDLVVGVPSAGQSLLGEENLIGHCINMLPIRTQLTSDMSLMDYLQHVKKIVLAAYDHQDYTFGSLLDKLPLTRDTSRIPLVPITFNIDQEPRDPDYGDLRASYFCNPRRSENFELAVNCYESPNGLMVEMSYNTDLFDQATILQRVAEFKTLIEEMVTHPDKSLVDYAIVPNEVRQTLLHSWNETQMTYPQQAVVHELISAQAEKYPDRVAVVAGLTEITYGELNGRSNQLARHLQSLGVQPDALIAVSLERTVDLLVATLAIWKSGGAYVPLDPAYPTERLGLMLADSGASILLTQSSLQTFLPEHSGRVVLFDEDWPHIETLSDLPLPNAVTPAHLAYVIYTSGSTGKPKGVQVPHGAVVNFLVSMSQTPGLASDDTLLAVTTLSFDIHVLELYLPLLQGARIILASQAEATNGEALLRLIQAHHVTVMQATPVSWRLLIAAGWSNQDAIKVLVGGEALPPDLASELLTRGESVWNMYGPTETTVWSTCYQVTDPDAPILIGKPIGNTQVYVLNQAQQLTPIGVPGELYIGGDGVTRGYLGRPDLTQERFVPNPFSDEPERKLYRTGDLVSYLPDGNLQYFRRLDNQVKVRGFRIELGDIETNLSNYPAIIDTVVIVREDQQDDKRIVAYYISEGELETPKLHEYMSLSLPYYMIPSAFVKLESFPLTPNGKIDRLALPKPDNFSSQIGSEFIPPQTEVEISLATIWSDILETDKIGINDNFFELGGHSLLATRVINQMFDQYNIRISLSLFFEAPTIAGLSPHIEDELRQIDGDETIEYEEFTL